MALGVLAIRQEKEIQVIQIRREEVKLPLCVDDVILYKEKPKGWIQKPLKPINELSKVLGYKVNIQKSLSLHLQ